MNLGFSPLYPSDTIKHPLYSGRSNRPSKFTNLIAKWMPLSNMDLEAVFNVEDSTYSIVDKPVSPNLILSARKRPGYKTLPGLCILQKLSHIVHALIYNLIVLYFIKQRPVADIEQFGRFPSVPVGFV